MDLQDYEPPTKAQEADMTENELVEANIPFALQRASYYWERNRLDSRAYTFDDYRASACEGLVIASRKFDKSVGVKFISYAVHHIDQRLRDLRDRDTNVHIPINRRHDYFSLVRHSEPNESFEDTGKRLGWEIGRVQKALIGHWRPVRVRLELTDEYREATDLIAGDTPEYDDTLDAIHKALSKLDGRSGEVLRMYFFDDMTLDEIGQVFGVTRERIRQIKHKALLTLRQRHGSHLRLMLGSISDAPKTQTVSGLMVLED